CDARRPRLAGHEGEEGFSGGAQGSPARGAATLMVYIRRGFGAREHFDWPLFLCVAIIAIAGVVNLYSATSPYIDMAAKTSLADIYVTQVYWLVVGGLMGILVAMIDYRNFERLAYFVYVGGILLLMLVFVLASDVRGASRWIRFGSFAFQPSEFMKI